MRTRFYAGRRCCPGWIRRWFNFRCLLVFAVLPCSFWVFRDSFLPDQPDFDDFARGCANEVNPKWTSGFHVDVGGSRGRFSHPNTMVYPCGLDGIASTENRTCSATCRPSSTDGQRRRRVFLHIGPPKTASSAIQRYLNEGAVKNCLKTHSRQVKVLNVHPYFTATLLGNPGLNDILAGDMQRGRTACLESGTWEETCDQLATERHRVVLMELLTEIRDGDVDLLLSDEGLSTLGDGITPNSFRSDAPVPRMSLLLALFACFDVHVVMFHRERISHAFSRWAEIRTGGSSPMVFSPERMACASGNLFLHIDSGPQVLNSFVHGAQRSKFNSVYQQFSRTFDRYGDRFSLISMDSVFKNTTHHPGALFLRSVGLPSCETALSEDSRRSIFQVNTRSAFHDAILVQEAATCYNSTLSATILKRMQHMQQSGGEWVYTLMPKWLSVLSEEIESGVDAGLNYDSMYIRKTCEESAVLDKHLLYAVSKHPCTALVGFEDGSQIHRIHRACRENSTENSDNPRLSIKWLTSVSRESALEIVNRALAKVDFL